jgi:hypothetical protein
MREKILKYFDLSIGLITIFLALFFLVVACPMFSKAYSLRSYTDYGTNGKAIYGQICYYIVTGSICTFLFVALFGTSFMNFNKIHNGRPLKNLHELELVLIFASLLVISVACLILMPYNFFNVIFAIFGFFGIVLTLSNVFMFKGTYIGFILDMLECLFIVIGIILALNSTSSYISATLGKESILAVYKLLSALLIIYGVVLDAYFGLRDYKHDYFKLAEDNEKK